MQKKELVVCPKCKTEMFEVYYGDDVRRWRCMECDRVFSHKEFLVGKGESVRFGWYGRR